MSDKAPIAQRDVTAEGAKGEKRGRRNRIRPQNWGYTTYLDRVFGMRCFEDLVRLRVFPDAKDISESYGALQACTRQGLMHTVTSGGRSTTARQEELRKGVLCISIGDGSTARTACLAAFLTSWHAVSVDPCLREEWTGSNPHGVARLHGVRAKFEDWMQDAPALEAIRAAVARDNPPEAGSDEAAARPERPELTSEGSVRYARSQHAAWLAWLAAEEDRAIVGGEGRVLGDPALYDVGVRRAFCEEMLPARPASEEEGQGGAGGVAHLLLVCVHAHHRFVGSASIPAVRAAFGNPPTTVVALPCCATFNPTKDIGRAPDTRFEDEAVFSARREVLVWHWERGRDVRT